MTCPVARITYSGTAPGADTNDYTLFSTVTAFSGPVMGPQNDIRRLSVDIAHNANGTLKFYKSQNRGGAWSLVQTDSITAGSTTTKKEYLVEAFADYKLDWTNGGSAQTTWLVDIALSDDRGPSS